jgi:hypothetical protein
MSIRLDEVLEALPGVGLDLIYLGQHTGADPWGCLVRESDEHRGGGFDGQGQTPLTAIMMALRKAGVNVEDAG